jgi:hypothetical protein
MCSITRKSATRFSSNFLSSCRLKALLLFEEKIGGHLVSFQDIGGKVFTAPPHISGTIEANWMKLHGTLGSVSVHVSTKFDHPICATS